MWTDVPHRGLLQGGAEPLAVHVGGPPTHNGEGLGVPAGHAGVAIELDGWELARVDRGGELDEHKIKVNVGVGRGPSVGGVDDRLVGADGLSLTGALFLVGVVPIGHAEGGKSKGTLAVRGREEDVGGDEGGGAGVVGGGPVGAKADQIRVAGVGGGGSADNVWLRLGVEDTVFVVGGRRCQ